MSRRFQSGARAADRAWNGVLIRGWWSLSGAVLIGAAIAFLAADLGMEVTVVDPEANPGGVCLYRGCIPSKALLHVAKLIREADEAADWGVRFGTPEIDLDRLRSWKDGVVEKLTGGLGVLTKQRKIRHVRGRAKFSSPTVVEIEGTIARSALASGGGIRTYPGNLEWAARMVPGGTRYGPLKVAVRPDLEWSLEVDLGRPPKSVPADIWTHSMPSVWHMKA